MQIYSVGKDDLDVSDYTFKEDDYEWIVYDYENYGYEGGGEAVALNKGDGLLYIKNLGHCSCYGPMDCWETNCSKVTIEEFFRDKDSIFDQSCKDTVTAKVYALLGRES